MKVHKILVENGAIKEEYFGYPYKLETKTGTVGIDLRKNHLFCNFVGSEKQAQIKFGHWKERYYRERTGYKKPLELFKIIKTWKFGRKIW